MRKIILVVISFNFCFLLYAQTDYLNEPIAVDTLNLIVDSDSLLTGPKAVGDHIPHLVLFNLVGSKTHITLSVDGANFSSFTLKGGSKTIIRCDNLNRLFLEVEPSSSAAIYSKIFRSCRYKIFYDEDNQMYDIVNKPKIKIIKDR